MVASTVPPIMSTMNRMKVEPEAVEAEDEKLLAKEMQPPTTPPRLKTIQKTEKYRPLVSAVG